METYNTARFHYGYKGIHHIIHYTLVSWSLQDIHLRLVYQRLAMSVKCSVTYDKTKCHRSPSLMSYNISEIDVNSIKSNQIKLHLSLHTKHYLSSLLHHYTSVSTRSITCHHYYIITPLSASTPSITCHHYYIITPLSV